MKLIAFVFTTLFSLAVFSQSSSNSVKGYIHIENNQYWLNTHSSNNLLISAPQDILNILSQLSDGDYIVGSGGYFERYPTNNVVYLSSIDFVGLNRVLGMWKTSNQDYFEFKDFSNLKLIKNLEISDNVISKSINYSLAPESERIWSLFLAYDDKVEVAQLITTNISFLEIQLFDKETGAPLNKVKLFPVRAGQEYENLRYYKTNFFMPNSPFPRNLGFIRN